MFVTPLSAGFFFPRDVAISAETQIIALPHRPAHVAFTSPPSPSSIFFVVWSRKRAKSGFWRSSPRSFSALLRFVTLSERKSWCSATSSSCDDIAPASILPRSAKEARRASPLSPRARAARVEARRRPPPLERAERGRVPRRAWTPSRATSCALRCSGCQLFEDGRKKSRRSSLQRNHSASRARRVRHGQRRRERVVQGRDAAHVRAARAVRAIGARSDLNLSTLRLVLLSRLARPSRPRLNARSSDADDPPPHPRSFSSQKLQRAGFVSVRDVKKTRGPVELALGASASPLPSLLPRRLAPARRPSEQIERGHPLL
eukprot:31180-Pelagococcus_subviridis.AAC.17